MLAALHIPVATLCVDSVDSEPHNTINWRVDLSSPPTVLAMLPHIPSLHLSLLVAAARLETIHDLSTLNFALVHDHHVELLARSKSQGSTLSYLTKGGAITGAGMRSWSKATARAAWEELAQWELIVPVSGFGGQGGGKTVEDGLGGEGIGTTMFRIDVTLEELAWAAKTKSETVASSEMLAKWCTEV